MQTINKLTLNPGRLFLVDGLGAGLTAISLAAILKFFNEYFGMPPSILKLLSIIAAVFAFYSICCFFFAGDKWRIFLRIISIANILYCCFTIVVVINYFAQLTMLGVSYFLLEIVIITCLVFLEIKALGLRN